MEKFIKIDQDKKLRANRFMEIVKIDFKKPHSKMASENLRPYESLVLLARNIKNLKQQPCILSH